jgi:aminoglycoside phosphotransferase (APT) family kinase protein
LAIYHEMNRVIAALHSQNPDALGLADYGKPGNYFVRQIGRWTKQYQASETETIQAMNELINWLPANVPHEDEVAIVHGDYRLDNLIFDSQQAKVLAILDWELSTLGAPLADFSYHCMSFHIPPGQFRGIGGLDLAALNIPTEHDYIRLYCERTGRSLEQVTRHWQFYMAYNMFRLAAILQGIMKRVVDGTASSQQAVASGRSAKPLAELGWAFVNKKH